MKNDKWSDMLRQQLADSKAPVPDNLWNNIEHLLDSSRIMAGQKAQHTRHTKIVRTVALLSIAASIVLLLVITGHYTNTNSIGKIYKYTAQNSLLNKTGQSIPCDKYGKTTTVATIAKATPQMHTNYNFNMQNPEVKIDEKPSAENNTSNINENDASSNCYSDYRDNNNRPMVTTIGSIKDKNVNNEKSRWSVAAHTSATFNESHNTLQPFRSAPSRQEPYTAIPVLLAKHGETRHHAKPISYGFSVGYALNDKLSLTTGIVYTQASSDFTNITGNDKIVNSQQLHYIGVPIGIKCNVWGNSIVQTYATAHIQADFNVKTTLTTSDIKKDINKDNVQFSSGIAAGVQVNVIPQLGIYAEPGLKYYFNNGSDVETIFKDKPCCFNMQIGIRLNL